MNKKILAILMALLMVLMSSVAFAEEGSTTAPADAETVSITKNYTGTDKPEQTFTFKATALASKTNEGDIAADKVPAIGNATVTIAADGASATTTFDLPNYTLPGIYNYTLTEIPGNTAGVEYNTENASYDLKVTVISNVDAQGNTTLTRIVALRPAGQTSKESKLATATFNNTYTADTNGLSVTKVLAGNYADTRDTFTIQVTFTAAKDTVLASDIKYDVTGADGVKVTKDENSYVYTLTGIGHNDTVKFTNIPAGVEWYVNETDNTGSETDGVYEAKYSDKDQKGTIGTDSAITVTNERNTELDTGVFTDSMPYIMLMAFVMILAAAVVLKKRTVNE